MIFDGTRNYGDAAYAYSDEFAAALYEYRQAHKEYSEPETKDRPLAHTAYVMAAENAAWQSHLPEMPYYDDI